MQPCGATFRSLWQTTIQIWLWVQGEALPMNLRKIYPQSTQTWTKFCARKKSAIWFKSARYPMEFHQEISGWSGFPFSLCGFPMEIPHVRLRKPSFPSALGTASSKMDRFLPRQNTVPRGAHGRHGTFMSQIWNGIWIVASWDNYGIILGYYGILYGILYGIIMGYYMG